MPSSRLPEMRLPSGPSLPPITFSAESSMKTPACAFGSATVPFRFVPIRFPRMTTPLALERT
jgi:hypothetical protein